MDTALLNLAGLLTWSVLLLASQRSRPRVEPAAIGFTLMWAFAIIMSQLIPQYVEAPSVNALAVFYCAGAALLIGELADSWFGPRFPVRSMSYRPVVSRFALTALLLLQMTAIYVEMGGGKWLSMAFAGWSQVVEALTIQRLTQYSSFVNLPWYLELVRWSSTLYVPLTMVLQKNRIISRYALIPVVGLGFVSASVRTTRAPILHLLVLLLFCWIVLYRPDRKRLIVVSTLATAVFIIVFFLVSATIMRYDQPVAGTGTDLVEYASAYFAAPLKAYDYLLTSDVDLVSRTGLSFDALNFVRFRLGLISSYPDLVGPVTLTPTVTNLYTFLDAWTIDFGVPFALVIVFALGVVLGNLQRRALRVKSFLALFMYSYVSYGLLMSIANNEFIRFGFWLQVVLAVIVESAIVSRGRDLLPLRAIEQTMPIKLRMAPPR